MLFPSASECADNTLHAEENRRDADWLQAKSFTSDTAKKVKEFQKELESLQGNSSCKDTHDSKGQSTSWSTGNEDKSHIIDHSKGGFVGNSSDEESSSSGLEDRNYDQKRRKKEAHNISSDDDNDDYDRLSEKTSDKRKEVNDHGHKRRRHKEKRRKKKSEHRHLDSMSSEEERHKRKKKKKKHKHQKEEKEEQETKVANIKDSLSSSQLGIFTKDAVFLEDLSIDIAPEDAFRVDRKPDKNNWMYGSLYKQHIAQYKDICLSVVGTRKEEVILMKEKEKNKKLKTSRYYDKESRKILRQKPVEVIAGNENICNNNEMQIRQSGLGNIVKIEKHIDDDKSLRLDARAQILDISTALYIQGKSKLESVEDVVTAADTLAQSAAMKKVAEFNKKLQVTPDNIQLWFDFIKFQDTVYIDDENFRSSFADLDGKLKRVILEKKISIAEKALQANPGNIDLILHKIELNTDLVDSTKIKKELEQLLFVHSANTRLWKYYLTFNQSRLALFTVTRMIKLYQKCLKTLIAILEGKLQTHSVPENLCREILDIVIQYCYFLKQAGHQEKTTGTLQAIVEYNFFCPPPLKSVAKETKMAALEEYWDSECPRVGCDNGTRWDVWYEKKEASKRAAETDSLEEAEEQIVEKKLTRSKSWLEIEALREKNHMFPWLPGQGQTDDDCEDADAIVVFDDIAPVLFDIPAEFHMGLIVALIALDQDIGSFQYSCMLRQLNSVIKYTSQVPDLLNSDISQLVASFHSSFSSHLLKEVISCFYGENRTIATLLYIDVRLKMNQNGQVLSKLNKTEKKEVRKILKDVLKQEHNRNNLYIWAVYVDIERQIGKQSEVLSIVETAITMHSGSAVKWFVNEDILFKKQKVEYVSGLMNLFVQYIEILLGIASNKLWKLLPRTSGMTNEIRFKVQYVISCLVEGKRVDVKHCEEIPGATKLRILSKFPKCIQVILDSMKTESTSYVLLKKELLASCWCSCLFSYCCNGLQSGLDIYTNAIQSANDVISDVINFSDLEERLLESRMRLIMYHMTVSPSPLHILRENLDDALTRYPDSERFLSLFVDVEHKARISGRLNRYFDKQSRLAKSPISVIVAINDLSNMVTTAKRRDCSLGEITHDVRSLLNRGRSWFENYINQSIHVNCPLLWRLYLQLEKLAGNESKMKGLFYRSIQQCPWNKNLYKDAIEVFGDGKLQEIVDLMIEKELRVHLPVEELDILLE